MNEEYEVDMERVEAAREKIREGIDEFIRATSSPDVAPAYLMDWVVVYGANLEGSGYSEGSTELAHITPGNQAAYRTLGLLDVGRRSVASILDF